MRKPVTNPLEPRCGNCKFWDRLDQQPPGVTPDGETGACGGMPFQCVLTAARPRQFGGFDLQMEQVRPNTPACMPPCALYHPAPSTIIGAQKLDS